MSKPGITYLIVNEGLNAIKVGVTAVGSNRLSVFQRQGWAIVGQEHFESGFEAFSAEQSILRWWRDDLQLSPYLSAESMPAGGWSETAELESVPLHIVVTRLHAAAERVRTTASAVSAEARTSFGVAEGTATRVDQNGLVRLDLAKPAGDGDSEAAPVVALLAGRSSIELLTDRDVTADPILPAAGAEAQPYGQVRLF